MQVLRTRPPLEGSRGLASVQLWLATGTCDEGKGQHGAAHMLEHMVFRPWGPEPGDDLANEIEGSGGEVNAYTSHDETVFHATLPARGAEFALCALSRAVIARKFEASDYEREREVVVEEIHQYEDDAAAVVGDQMLGQLFGDDGYGRPILGSEASLRGMDVRALSRFYRRTYVGSRLRVVVVGTVSPAKIFALAERLFGELPAGRARKVPRRWPRNSQRTLSLPRVPGTESPVRLAWAGPAIHHEDAVALDLLSVCLGQGESSRLSVALRFRERLALDTYASYLVGARGGSLSVSVTCPPASIAGCVERVREEVERLRQEPPGAEELARARAMLRSSLIYRKETVQGQAQALGYYMTVADDPELEARYFETLDALEGPTLLAVARRYLTEGAEHLCIGLPRDAMPGKELTALRKGLKRRLSSQAKRATKPKARPWHRPRPELWAHDFPNGLRLRIHRDTSLPLAAGWIAWPGGQRLETTKNAGVGSLMSACIGRAAPGRSPLEIGRWLDTRAALLDGFFGRSSMGLALESTSDSFDELFELALDCSFEPEFDARELARQRKNTLEDLQAQAEDPGLIAVRGALRAVYARHPQGRPLRGESRVVEKVGVEQLASLMARQNWGDALVSLAGDVDPERVADQLMRRVERVESEGPRFAEELATLSGAPRRRRREKVIEKERPDAAQSQLVLAYPGVTQSDPRRLAMDLMCEYLGAQTGPPLSRPA